MPVWIILFVTALYLAGLFWIAWRRDREATEPGFVQHPIIYALAIAVYCTSWTYFGAVGTAVSSGWDYLPIYLGPIIVFTLMPGLVRRIGDIVRREGVTSLSDFLSARYGKSQSVATLATIAAVTGSLPYIALQLKSVGMSFVALAQSVPQDDSSRPADETVLVMALILAVFAILFGARQSDKTRHNAGLMRVLALEALVKLGALLAVCLLSLSLLGSEAVTLSPDALTVFEPGSLSARFITITLLSMGAIICLPRQFHITMIERRDRQEMATARWLFPLYLTATSLVVVPIALVGMSVLPANSPADLYVLNLPLSQGDGILALIVFLGGFSAAMGMVIVSTVALSTMVTNDLIVPALLKSGRFSSLTGDSGARLLSIRRGVILALLLLAYGYYRAAGGSEALAQIGLLSFAAAIQFAPALLGAIYWKDGRRAGAIAGLILGLGIWAYTLFLPALLGHGRFSASVPDWLNPHALFGASFGDSLTHGVIWSLGLNLAGYIIGSLRARERLRDRVQAAAFTGQSEKALGLGRTTAIPASQVTPDGLRTLAARFLDLDAVNAAFEQFEVETGEQIDFSGPADWRLVQRTERMLARALGSSSARVVMASAVGGMDVALPDVLSILDSRTQAERFDRHMLQSMLENIHQGISVVDQDQCLVAWNSAYVDLFDYPPDLIHVGRPIADLIAYNLDKGWIEGDPAEEARRRIEHMRKGRSHMYERQNPDGRFLRIAGNPMPGGGYVTTFTDITDDKRREQALVEANETLEARVRERTSDLEAMAADLHVAREDAEGANASKTRFLAAASHDLLQPLNAARLFLGALMADEALASDQSRATIAKTDRAIQSADDLLKGLLDISRLDHGHVTAQPVQIALGPLLEDLADEATPMAEKVGLTLRVAPTRLSVHADPDFLTSILRNFISNARRYTKQGGVLIGARRRGDVARIEVWDTGPGISKSKQALLFEEFQRFDDTDNMGLRGAGLGLSVAHRLAGIMGCEIMVRSRPGTGSVFSVDVPLTESVPVKPAASPAPERHGARNLSNLRILCVDDEASIRDGMATLLSRWGCEVRAVATYNEALNLAETGGFDVVIADLQLKDVRTGLNLIQATRAYLSDRDNVALLTAQATESVVETARAEGISLLRKPVNPDDLRAFLTGCAARLPAQAAE